MHPSLIAFDLPPPAQGRHAIEGIDKHPGQSHPRQKITWDQRSGLLLSTAAVSGEYLPEMEEGIGWVEKDAEQSIALGRRQPKQIHICVERLFDACCEFKILDTTDLGEQVDESLTVEVADRDPHEPHRWEVVTP